MKKAFLILNILTILLFAGSPMVLATHCPGDPNLGHANGQTLPCPIKTLSGFVDLITKVFNILFGLMIVFASFMLLYGAFLYINAEANPEKINEARKTLIYTVVALVIAVFAWGFPKVLLIMLS